MFARYIHRHSARAKGPFRGNQLRGDSRAIAGVDAIWAREGRFTGASQAQAGKSEQAENGTLLLDEISEMPFAAAGRCCACCRSVRESGLVGRSRSRSIFASLATTNRDMAAEVAAGVFPEDLYYRLNVFR